MTIKRISLSRFRREDGGVTIEAAIWLPFFFVLLTMVADIALIFHGQSRAFDVMAAANRAFSAGEIASREATEDAIETALAVISPNATVVTKIDDGLVSSIATIPSADLTVLGIVRALGAFDVKITAQQYMEF